MIPEVILVNDKPCIVVSIGAVSYTHLYDKTKGNNMEPHKGIIAADTRGIHCDVSQCSFRRGNIFKKIYITAQRYFSLP